MKENKCSWKICGVKNIMHIMINYMVKRRRKELKRAKNEFFITNKFYLIQFIKEFYLGNAL